MDLSKVDLSDIHAVAVDDDNVALRILTALASQVKLNLECFSNPGSALDYIKGNEVDLIFTDYMMGSINGVDFTKSVREYNGEAPIIMITSLSDDDVLKLEALEAGATEFLTKPLNISEFKVRVVNLAKLRRFQRAEKNKAKILEQEVKKATQSILDRELETIYILGRAAEYKDNETGFHIQRVGHYARLLAEGLGLSEHEQDIIYHAAPLHDIGKLGIPDAILTKPGKLTVEEFGVIKTHPQIGHDMLAESKSLYLKRGALIAVSHHEKWDGSGYPQGLKGDSIPVEGRMVAIADVFDALLSERPYKKAWPLKDVMSFFKENAGSHFDPNLIEVLFDHLSDVINIHNHIRSSDEDFQEISVP